MRKPDAARRRRVLVLAYYFPPMGLSGVQRTTKFVKYLPESGWDPTVLTCEPGGYFAYDSSLLEEIEAARIPVHRTRTWDPTRLFPKRSTVRLPAEPARKTFSYLSQLVFIPDNKVGWFPPARRRGLELLDAAPFDVIFSTAPPYTAHLVGASLAWATGIPLVLDFRDDWLGNPRHTYVTPLHRTLSAGLEGRALRRATRTIVINEVIRSNLLERNPRISPDRVRVIPQGFDPADFEATPASQRSDSGKCTFLYSGVFYDAQTPEPFFRALAEIVERRPEARDWLRAEFIGLLPESGRRLAAALGVADLIRYRGYQPHEKAVAHLQSADVLWMMVGRTPGSESISTSKLYEYFGARKPILGIVPEGAARQALADYGAAWIADPDDPAGIRAAMSAVLEAWEAGRLPLPSAAYVRRFDRRVLGGALAALFDEAIGEPRETPAEVHHPEP